MISLLDLWKIFRKYLARIVAFALCAGILSFVGVSILQTYTCTLNYSYAYDKAAEGLAPNGRDELNPYELKNPAVLQTAIDYVGIEDDNLTVEGIRNKITISEVITDLDREVSESAAVLGEKYEVEPTEFSMTYSYKAKYGEEFGLMMFDGLIRAYDDFIISKYYNKKHISDFMQNIDTDTLDYLELATVMEDNINDILYYLEDMAEWYPDFRSVRTGYTFDELAAMYENLWNIQYAKYYGNVRAGNLSKDSELVIADYNAKIKDLKSIRDVNNDKANNYKTLISTYYENYKEYGLYQQATTVHSSTEATNTNDFGVYRDLHDDYEKLVNTYDQIVQNYTDTAAEAAAASRSIDYYENIIDSFAHDSVSAETKKELLDKNDQLLREIRTLATVYAGFANDSVDELFDSRVTEDVQYLMSTDISTDKPVILITLFAMIAVGGIVFIFAIIYEVYFGKSVKKTEKDEVSEETGTEVLLDESTLDEEHSIAYEQYKRGFDEFYLVYQPMIYTQTNSTSHFETFIRWENEKLGKVSPQTIIDRYADLGLLPALNDWIINQVCRDIPRLTRRLARNPVVHINCLYSEVIDFGLNEMLLRNIRHYKVPASSICLELDGSDIMSTLEDIITLKDMGFQICVDHFENKEKENEILRVLEPEYVKMSSDVFKAGLLTDTSDRRRMTSYFRDILSRCERQNISACICGVESQEQDEFVDNLGFRYKQGFYYGKPMPLKELLTV